jgi:predicted Zn finger-like uncharacterized protein
MKFVCDNCSTQYLISDDKIGPKGVKVRCKRCGNVIIVRPEDEDRAVTGPSGMAAETAEGDNPFAQNSDGRDEVGLAFDQLLSGGFGPDDDEEEDEQATEIFLMNELDSANDKASDLDKIDEVFADAESTELKKGETRDRSDWYVAVGDEQIGPMTLLELESRWSDGDIGDSTLAWFPGMSDWTAIGEIAELRYLLGRQAVEQRENTEVDAPEDQPQEEALAASAQPAEDEWSPYKGSELASLVEEEIAAADSLPPPDDPVAEDSEQPFGGDLPDDEEEAPPWALDESASGEAAKPSENFFDSSLDKSAEGDDPDYLNGTYSRSGRVLSGPAYLGGAKQGSNKSKWILIGLLGGVILAGGAVTAVVMTSNGDPKPSDVEPIKPPDAGMAADGSAGPVAEKPGDVKPGDAKPADPKPADAKPGDGKPGTADPDGKEFVVARPAVENPKADVGVKDKTTPKKSRKRRRVVSSTVKNPVPKPDPKPVKPDPVADSSLPKKLSKSQISKTMKKQIGAMKQCVEQQRQRDPSVTGTMKVSFTIEPGGNVSTARIKTAQHQGTFVAGCILHIIKSMKFPKAQESFTVPVLPLKLGG